MNILDVKKTGEQIKLLMDEKGVKVKDIQKIMGFTTGYPVYKWINGQNMPTLDNLVLLAECLGVGLDQIVKKAPV